MSEYIKEFNNINVGNDLYNIELSKLNNGEDNSILITARNINNNSLYYQNHFSLDQLMSLSKTFRFCDDISEALNIISKIFELENKYYISNGEDELILHLKINLPSGDEQEIQLNLKKIESIENVSKDELLEKIKILEEENKRLKEEISMIKIDNIKKDKIIKSLTKNQNNNIQAENNNEKIIESNNEEEELDENILNTDIIQTQEEINFIENRLKQIYYFQDKNIKYQLLYKGTKNGDKALNFHTLVDGIKNTLTLVKSKKGIRFGGFTSLIWNQIGGYGKCDPFAFCFSLDLKKIYNSQKNQKAIFCSDGYCPYFKGTNTIFGIYNQFFTQGGWCDYTTSSYSFGKFDKNFEITDGEQSFEVDDVEVFKVYTE